MTAPEDRVERYVEGLRKKAAASNERKPKLYVHTYRRRTVLPSQRFGWRAKAGRHVVATSGEGYANHSHAEEMARGLFTGNDKYNVVFDFSAGETPK